CPSPGSSASSPPRTSSTRVVAAASRRARLSGESRRAAARSVPARDSGREDQSVGIVTTFTVRVSHAAGRALTTSRARAPYRGAMQRSDLALAALATAAVPGLRAVEVAAVVSDGDDDVALVVDDERRRWMVRSPRDTVAGASLEAEMALLRSFDAYVDTGRLPFAVPAPAGFAQLDEGGRAVVYPEIPGHPLPLEQLRPGPGLARAIGQAIAALHELPSSLVEDAGLPSYT